MNAAENWSAEVRADVARVREKVARLHAELPRWGLVVWTAGNVSERVRVPSSSKRPQRSSASSAGRYSSVKIAQISSLVTSPPSLSVLAWRASSFSWAFSLRSSSISWRRASTVSNRWPMFWNHPATAEPAARKG